MFDDQDDERIRQNVARMRAQHATDEEVEHYLRNVEGRQPVTPTMAVRDATAAKPRPAKLPPRAHSMSDDITGAAAQAGQGGTFGFGDELLALGAGLAINPMHPLKHFDKLRAQVDSVGQQYSADHPVASVAANIAGGLAGGVAEGAVAGLLRPAGAAVASKAPGMLAALGRGVKAAGTGAAIGGTAAFGSASGSLKDRLAAVPAGAAFGAAIPAGMGAVAKAGELSGITTAAQRLMPRPATRGPLPARIANNLGVATTEDLAKGDALKQLNRARVSFGDLEAKAAAAHPDEMLMDLIGQPAVERAGGAVATPSRGSADIVRALDERAQRAPKAVRGVASEALGVPRENTVLAEQAMNKQRQLAAKPLYDQAYAAAPIEDPEVLATMQLPHFKSAYKRAQRIAKLEGVDLPPLTKVSQVGGETVTEQVPLPVQAIDYVKRGLDDLIDSKMRSGGMGKAEARALKQRLAGVLETVDTQVPAYKAARASFAGDSKVMDAHELGQTFMKAKTDELAAMWPSLSEAEQASYRKGAIASIEDAVRGKTDGFNPVRDFRDDIMRDNLRIIMPDEASAQKFGDAVEKFHTMHTNRTQVVGNSKTASRLAQMEDAAGGGVGDMIHAAATSPMSLLNKAANNAITRRLRGLSEEQVNALAPLLTAHGDELTKVIAELKAYSAQQGIRRPLPPRALSQTAGAASAKP